MRIYLSVISLVVLTATVRGDSAGELRAVANDFSEWMLREFPETATYRGRHEYDDKLTNISTAAHDVRKAACDDFLVRVRAIDQTSLSQEDFNNWEVLERHLLTLIDGYPWRLYGPLNPMNFLEGAQRTPGWIRSMKFDTRNDFDVYARRLRQVPVYIDKAVDLMREAIRLGRTNHLVSMEAVPDQIVMLIKQANESAFSWPYQTKLENSSVPEGEREAVIQEGYSIVEDEINQAYTRLLDFVNTTYRANTRPQHGVGSFDDGKAYYTACLKFHLSEDKTPEEVRDVGLAEVGRIKGLMQKVMDREGFTGTLPEFFEHLRTDRANEFYGMSADELYEEFRNITYNRINPRVHMVIKNDPGVPVKVLPMPYDGPPALYGSNTFWVNLRHPETRPSFTMMALSIHEANPGHHLQITYAQRLETLEFRKQRTTLGYASAPLNFPWYTVYTEGWGLYAEFLGEEMNLYNTARLEMFGRYSWEILRACRLVVDTGMHAFGKTREWAIEYMANHTAMPIRQITLEIDRYITWPGQACAYKTGELEFKRLRVKAEQELGSLFDVRDFHKAVLDTGAAPMPVVERAVNAYIQANKPSSSSRMLLKWCFHGAYERFAKDANVEKWQCPAFVFKSPYKPSANMRRCSEASSTERAIPGHPGGI